VVDSPNEEIVREVGWHHPEHTIEFRPSDATALLDLAGFQVTKIVGHWLCRSSEGEILSRTDLQVDSVRWPVQRRVEEGLNRPKDCFSWWIESRKERPPNAAALIRFVIDLGRRYGDRRFQCGMHTAAPTQTVIDGIPLAYWPTWMGRLVGFGSLCSITVGRTLVGFTRYLYAAIHSPGRIEVFKTDDNRVLAEAMLPPVL
jgi:hypothetical protein